MEIEPLGGRIREMEEILNKLFRQLLIIFSDDEKMQQCQNAVFAIFRLGQQDGSYKQVVSFSLYREKVFVIEEQIGESLRLRSDARSFAEELAQKYRAGARYTKNALVVSEELNYYPLIFSCAGMPNDMNLAFCWLVAVRLTDKRVAAYYEGIALASNNPYFEIAKQKIEYAELLCNA